MGISNRWAIPSLVAGLMGALWCCAASPAPKDKPDPDKGLVVHEWGTFSTFAGSDGKNLKFEPYDNDLPDFVHGYQERNSKAAPAGGTISLETPVLYFYSKKALSASVQVEFPKGILTEWYPHAKRTDKKLVWQQIQVRPNEAVNLPSEKKQSRYYAARETDAAPLQVAFKEDNKKMTEQDKFLFYRGVGTFDMPLSARALGHGKFNVRWDGDALEDDLILVRVQKGKLRFQPFHLRQSKCSAEADVQVPDSDSTADKLGDTLAKLLIKKGLYEKEARAMVKTWSSAWFGEEGTRVLYILPDRMNGTVLPLRIEPKPASLVRVLVGRHDILTPEREKQIDVFVKKLKDSNSGEDAAGRTAAKEMEKLGRYRGAAAKAAEARLKSRR